MFIRKSDMMRACGCKKKSKTKAHLIAACCRSLSFSISASLPLPPADCELIDLMMSCSSLDSGDSAGAGIALCWDKDCTLVLKSRKNESVCWCPLVSLITWSTTISYFFEYWLTIDGPLNKSS
jgi:hypothetical protein